MLFIIFLFIGSFTLSNDNNNNVIPERDNHIIESQLKQYILEFEEFRSIDASWLIYLLIKDNLDHINILKQKVSNSNKYLETKAIIECIDHDNNHEYLSVYFLKSYVKCINDPNLIIAFLHDFNKYDVSIESLLNLLNRITLTKKQEYHYNFIINDLSDSLPDYIIDDTQHNLLDFYYYDYIYDINNSRNNYDYFVNLLNEKHSLDSTRDIRIFLTTINALHKSERESYTFNIAQNFISDYFDLPISTTSLRIFNYISYASYITGYYQYDIDLYRNIIIPLTKYFSKETQVRAKLDFGVSLFRIGNTTESLKVLEEAYVDFNNLTDFRYQSALLNNLGIAYLNTGYFEKYIKLQLEALHFAESYNNLAFEIHFLNNLYIYHRTLENWSTAFEYLNQIELKAIELNDKSRLSNVQLSYGTYYRDYKNDMTIATEYLYNALNIAQEINDYHIISSVLSEIADTYEVTGKLDRSLYYQNKRLQTAKSREDPLVLFYAYVSIANIFLEKNEPENAAPYIDSLTVFDRNQMLFRAQIDSESVIAKYLINYGKTEEAISTLSEFAANTISRIRLSSDVQSGHIYLESEYINLFKLLITQLTYLDRWDEAFYWMDEIKNISTATFFNNPALKSSILSESELIYDFALRNRIERLRSEIRTAESSRRIQLNNSLLEAISEQNVLRRKVLQNIDLEPVNLNRLRRQLGRSDIILYFSKLDNYLFASTITSGTYNITKLEFSDDELTRIDDLVEKLSTDRIPLTELAWFRERVIDKMNISDRYSNYIIVPDGFLYHIPLEILPIGTVSNDYSYGEATYLIEKTSISYINSLKDLERSFDHSPTQKHSLDFLGFGISHFDDLESQLLPGRSLPPLPLAEREVSEIASLLTRFSNNTYHLSENSTEAQFRKDAGNSRILHLASHSEVFDNDPLYSLIYLNHDNSTDGSGSSNQENDGLIYAYELFGMDLSSEMVMLNSCESGSGNYIQGSGIIGFSRAFNYAGVQSLVLNLWSIRDRSAYELSLSFYSYLNEGLGKHEAMRKAKIDYINYINSNPSSWGSFVVYGNTEPVVRSHSALIATVIFLILGSLSLFIGWYRLSTVSINRF